MLRHQTQTPAHNSTQFGEKVLGLNTFCPNSVSCASTSCQFNSLKDCQISRPIVYCYFKNTIQCVSRQNLVALTTTEGLSLNWSNSKRRPGCFAETDTPICARFIDKDELMSKDIRSLISIVESQLRVSASGDLFGL